MTAKAPQDIVPNYEPRVPNPPAPPRTLTNINFEKAKVVVDKVASRQVDQPQFTDVIQSDPPLQHTTLRKLLFNPILRLFGWQIVSVFAGKHFLRYEFRKVSECEKT